jgi:hypothetical protein
MSTLYAHRATGVDGAGPVDDGRADMADDVAAMRGELVKATGPMTSLLDLILRSAYDRRMTSDLDSGGESSIELRRQRIFRVRMRVGAGCFLLANFALHQWGDLNGTSPWRLVWAVLPLLPVVWIVIFIVLRVRQMDEYQVKLFFPGLAVGFTVAMVAAITVGTLSSAGLNVPNAGWPVALIGIVAWEFTNLLIGAPAA